MRPADFHKVLEGGTENRVSVLEETTRRFPYFSAAQVLLAEEYWKADHLDKQSQLEKASLRVVDRTFLYDLLHGQDEADVPELTGVDEEVAEIPTEQVSEVAEAKVASGLPNELIPDLQVYDISMAPDLVSTSEPEVEEPEEHDFLGWLNALDDDQRDEKPVFQEQRSITYLIDQFIENDPQISKREDIKFFSPQEAGRKSVEDDFGFVSETLAKIYEDQGDTQKAIKAYRSLQLRFPEKSSYFAARLKKLEELE